MFAQRGMLDWGEKQRTEGNIYMVSMDQGKQPDYAIMESDGAGLLLGSWDTVFYKTQEIWATAFPDCAFG